MHATISPKNSKIPIPMYMTKQSKNNIKSMYLHVIEYIQPSTIDKREAPR